MRGDCQSEYEKLEREQSQVLATQMGISTICLFQKQTTNTNYSQNILFHKSAVSLLPGRTIS